MFDVIDINLSQSYTSDIFTRFYVFPGYSMVNHHAHNESIILLTKFNWCNISARFGIFGAETSVDRKIVNTLGAQRFEDFIALRVDDLMNPMRYVPFEAMSPYINGWMSPDEDIRVTTDVLFDEFVKDTYVRNIHI